MSPVLQIYSFQTTEISAITAMKTGKGIHKNYSAEAFQITGKQKGTVHCNFKAVSEYAMSYSIFNTQYLKTNNAKYVQPLLSRDPGYIFTSIAVPNYLYLQHLTALTFVLNSVNYALLCIHNVMVIPY